MSFSANSWRRDARLWWTRLLTKQTQFILDLFVLITAFFFAYLIRFEFIFTEYWLLAALTQAPFVLLVQFAALIFTGVYSFVWKYIGLSEIKAFMWAALASTVPLLIIRFLVSNRFASWKVPLSVIFVDAMLAFGGVLGVRVLRRALYEKYEKKRREGRVRPSKRRQRVLLIGAGRAGVTAVRELQSRGDNDLDVVGFIDDDTTKIGSVIQRVKVLGTTAELPLIVHRQEIDQVVITIAQASRQALRSIVEVCEQIPVQMRIIPAFYEILQGRLEVSRLREVQIEDLLGRDQVQLDVEGISAFLAGKTVMVTGAGGSIGSELVRQVANFNPAQLLLVERSEFALFNIERELHADMPDLSIMPLTADVGDRPRMQTILKQYRPQVILHAAAHKHVPMMELNPTEAIKNNVLGTHCLGELAGELGAEVFVLISTDKAVRPTSIMGASKRLAELAIQALDRKFETRYVAVRFGNVIGSAGSVIPIFREQIKAGGPVTVTHPEMVRYFMTIPEAAQLVLQAGAMGAGGEIFVLDMGEPVKILDLARDTITLSGLKPFEDIDIVFTGTRPGEKLFEELVTDGEHASKTRHPKIFVGKIEEFADEKVTAALDRLQILSINGQVDLLRRYINEVLPEAQLEIAADPVVTAEPPPSSKVLAGGVTP
ncbi:MAG: nucleoside-diphosphate sugar epimerase/dehydratase [Pyrinomonadaceae bacterium]